MKLDGDLGAYLDFFCKLFVMTKGLHLVFGIKCNIHPLFSLLIAISLFSCAGLRKHPKPYKASYGGAFGLGQSSILLTLIFIFI